VGAREHPINKQPARTVVAKAVNRRIRDIDDS